MEVTADDLADEEWGPVKGKKGKKGKGKKGKAAQDDEDEDAAPGTSTHRRHSPVNNNIRNYVSISVRSYRGEGTGSYISASTWRG